MIPISISSYKCALPSSRIKRLNFWGVINTVKAFLPELIERPEGGDSERVEHGVPYAPSLARPPTGASKAAVRLLTEALYAELMATNVAVT